MSLALTFRSITVERSRLNEHKRRVPIDPVAQINLATPAGTIRSAELDERQLVRLIAQAAAALTILQEDPR